MGFSAPLCRLVDRGWRGGGRLHGRIWIAAIVSNGAVQTILVESLDRSVVDPRHFDRTALTAGWKGNRKYHSR
jgi:hypothetical protein